MHLRRLVTGLLLPGLLGATVTAVARPAAADPPATVYFGELPLTLALGPGRAYITEWWVSPGMPASRFTVTQSGPAATVGPPTLVDYLYEGLGLSVSAGRAFYDRGYLRKEGANTSILVSPPSIRIVRLSGHRALYVEQSGANEWPALYDLRTGTHSAPFGAGADRRYPTDLWGEYFVWALPDGSIHRRDLRTGAVTMVKPAGGTVLAVRAYAQRVAWVTACPDDHCDTGQTLNWRTVGSGAVSTVATSGTLGLRLGGARIVHDRVAGVQRQLVSVDLVTFKSTVIGTLAYADERTYDLYDELVGWIGGAGDHAALVPIAPHVEASRYLGNAIAPAEFTPYGQANTVWRAAFPLSKPLTACSVAFSKDGVTVRTIDCAAKTAAGLAAVAWNGRDNANQLVAKGTYAWTLTGADPDGQLRWYDDSGAAISGTVNVA